MGMDQLSGQGKVWEINNFELGQGIWNFDIKSGISISIQICILKIVVKRDH